MRFSIWNFILSLSLVNEGPRRKRARPLPSISLGAIDRLVLNEPFVGLPNRRIPPQVRERYARFSKALESGRAGLDHHLNLEYA